MNYREHSVLFLVLLICFAIMPSCQAAGDDQIQPGAHLTGEYLPLLEGKSIGIVANQTSLIHQTHLVDSLMSLGLDIRKVFAPEHGFRGRAEAGETVRDGKDLRTGLPVVSLYGSNRKPRAEDLADLDIVIFDLQDVGVRFFTYLSTLTYLMEACAENNLELLILDRPNPNGFYIDGPLMDPEHKSFIGLHRIPVVHGMTIGECGLMLNGEGWLANGLKCSVKVITCENYTHRSLYKLPVPPSPNLPNMNSVYLYPSTCFFEGTVLSEGRGTESPFEVFGHPELQNAEFTFTPVSLPGFSASPKLQDQLCYGVDLRHYRDSIHRRNSINLDWLLEAYQNFPDKENFFIPFFENLSGTTALRNQVIRGLSAEEIRESWRDDLEEFKRIRINYLLYED